MSTKSASGSPSVMPVDHSQDVNHLSLAFEHTTLLHTLASRSALLCGFLDRKKNQAFTKFWSDSASFGTNKKKNKKRTSQKLKEPLTRDLGRFHMVGLRWSASSGA